MAGRCFNDARRGGASSYCCALIGAALVALIASPAAAASFPLAVDQVLVGASGVYTTRAEDTLPELARRNDLGYGQLVAVNPGIDPWLPGAGKTIALPSSYILPDGPRSGIVINLAEQRLYYFPPDGQTVETYPIGIGVEADMTPLGTTQITAKEAQPSWYPPPSIRAERPELPEVIPPGPDNPLGEFALRLGWPNYLIHGTHKPYGVGRHVSHGCIRLYPEDIRQLFTEVSVGTRVRVTDEPIRLAWVAGELYLAVSPSRKQMDQIDNNERVAPDIPPDLNARVADAAGLEFERIDWKVVNKIALQRSGVPAPITRARIAREAKPPALRLAGASVNALPPGRGGGCGPNRHQP